jgi:TonB family protein
MKLTFGLAISIGVHSLLFFAGWSWLAWQRLHPGFVTDIDLQSSSLLLRPRHTVAGVLAAPPAPWVLATATRRTVPRTTARPTPVPITTRNEDQAEAGPAGNPALGWVPASAAAQVPEWIEGTITEEDYPVTARKQGREGRVVASVVIDAAGGIQEVRIIEGRDEDFNQVVLERLRQARFRPGLDRNGDPIAVRMTIPVIFELH